MKKFQQVISLIDLTSLNLDDTDVKIITLCEQAQTPMGNVAAVCVYPKFVKLAKQQLINSDILVATVVNFPYGEDLIDQVVNDISAALADGADEIDVVIPYHEVKNDNAEKIQDFIAQCKQACGTVTLKVILETGELTADEIAQASRYAIAGGADMLKTSTGKVAVHATLEAAEIMLTEIKNSGKNIGLKISGGVRTVAQAEPYITLATKFMGEPFIDPKTFRFGASNLLNDVLASNKY